MNNAAKQTPCHGYAAGRVETNSAAEPAAAAADSRERRGDDVKAGSGDPLAECTSCGCPEAVCAQLIPTQRKCCPDCKHATARPRRPAQPSVATRLHDIALNLSHVADAGAVLVDLLDNAPTRLAERMRAPLAKAERAVDEAHRGLVALADELPELLDAANERIVALRHAAAEVVTLSQAGALTDSDAFRAAVSALQRACDSGAVPTAIAVLLERYEHNRTCTECCGLVERGAMVCRACTLALLIRRNISEAEAALGVNHGE